MPFQRGTSSRKSAENSSGVLPTGSIPIVLSLFLKSESSSARCTSRLSLRTISCGTPVGPTRPTQTATSKPGSPELDHGRNVRCNARALPAGRGQRLEPAFADERHRRHDIAERHRHLAGDRGSEAWHAATIGDMRDLDARQSVELGERKVRRRPDAGGTRGQLRRLRLRELNQPPHRIRRQRRIGHEYQRILAGYDDRCKIAQRIVFDAAVGRDIDGERRVGREEQRVAVRGRLGHEIGADIATGPWPIFDDHRLPPRRRQPWTEHAGQDIDRASWGVRHDEADRMLRIFGARRGIDSNKCGQREAGSGTKRPCHDGFSLCDRHSGARWPQGGGTAALATASIHKGTRLRCCCDCCRMRMVILPSEPVNLAAASLRRARGPHRGAHSTFWVAPNSVLQGRPGCGARTGHAKG